MPLILIKYVFYRASNYPIALIEGLGFFQKNIPLEVTMKHIGAEFSDLLFLEL